MLVMQRCVACAALAIITLVSPVAADSEFIAIFKEDTSDSVQDEVIDRVLAGGGTILHRYKTIFKGFAAGMTDSTRKEIERHPAVESLELDGAVGTARRSQAVQRSIKADRELSTETEKSEL